MADLRAYRVLLTPDPSDGGFIVRVPAFPAIITQGDDLQDALAMAQDAIELELAEALATGVDPPAPDADSNLLVETVLVESPAA